MISKYLNISYIDFTYYGTVYCKYISKNNYFMEVKANVQFIKNQDIILYSGELNK